MKDLEGDLGTALYAALSSPAVCEHFLAQPQLALQFNSCAIGLEGNLPAHLMAGACMARLCLVEVKNQPVGRKLNLPFTSVAQTRHMFDAVWQSVRKAILVSNGLLAMGIVEGIDCLLMVAA